MLTQIDLNKSPYFDDYDVLKQYYRMLFTAGKAVQVRELNQMQAMAQNQIESFADNIFKKGTIIDGCNFNFYTNYPYVKLEDSTIDGSAILPTDYIGLFAVNANNLQAFIINAADGFEASDPDLKTIYLTYRNSGDTGNTTAYSVGETLTIYDANNSIPVVKITSGGTGFSNSDTVVYVPAIRVRCTTGAFSNGDNLIQPSTGANVEIITATQVPSSNDYILNIKPRDADLANSSVNALAWTISLFEDVRNVGNTVAASVVATYGTDFDADIVTNGIGKVTEVQVINGGEGFTELPFITIQSANNLTGIGALDLTPQNYVAKVKISSNPDAVGSGYAFSVSEGIIYQKGFFVKVLPQTSIISKYDQSPNNVVVGFDTREEIITSNIDTSLLDNALGEPNETAPGADRLKLIPQLVVISANDALANTNFSALVQWSEGQPYKQNQKPQYSGIGDEMAQRTFDTSGNFVVDTFQIATTSTANSAKEGSAYTVVVDPGQAYISGHMTQTLRNYYIDVDKGVDTAIANNTVSLNYGSYIFVNQVGGLFQFSTAANVEFYDTAKGFLGNTTLITTGNTTPQGTKIGTARMRSMISETGTPGDPNAVYRLYLFDIRMNAGMNFSAVKSVYFNSTNKGIADVVQTINPTTNALVTVLNSPTNDQLIFSAGVESLKNSNATAYTYRTIDQTATFANTGILTKSIASIPNEFYPYSTGPLSSSDMLDLYVVPIGNTLTQYTSLTGNLSVNNTSNLVTGSGTALFNDIAPGDYIKVTANGTTNQTKKVVAVINAISAQVDSDFSFTAANCSFKRVFPQNVPIPFGNRTGLSGNVDINQNILKLGLYHANGTAITLEGTGSITTAIGVNIKRTGITSTSKTANRKQFVKIACTNNAGNTVGPWCLGVPDIFRFRGAWVGNSTVNTSSTNATSYFYIDHNQNANYLDLGWLMLNPRKKLVLSSSDYILVEFDYFTRSDDGYFDTVSYLGTANQTQISNLNSLAVANLTSHAASFEVPEVYTYKGQYFDLLNNFDFRPQVTATVSPSTDPTTAPLNPNSALSFGNTADPTNDKKFPLPDSTMVSKIEHYLGRVDGVYIADTTGEIYVLKGIPNVDPRKRFEANHPKDTLKLQTLTVPAYPNLTDNPSANTKEVLATGVFNERASGIRTATHIISPILSSEEFQLSQPMVYTMEDIAALERRIKDLEYVSSLSLLETSITNKIIPSSVDGSLNRFKFGFFADDFSTITYSDLNNPQYAASIETEGTLSYGQSKNPLDTNTNWANSDATSPTSTVLSPTKIVQRRTNRIVPSKFIWTMPHHINNLAYIDEPIISQDYATDTANTVVDGGCVPKIVTNVVPQTNGYYYISSSGYGQSSVSNRITLGGKSGTVTIYFNNGDSQVEYQIFKGNTVIASTAAAANSIQNLSANNIAFLDATSSNTGFVSKPYGNFVRSGDFVSQAGKFTFSHNPATGSDYDVLTTYKSGSFWQYLVEYPLTNPSTTTTQVDPCVIINNVTDIKATPPVSTTFVGTLIIPPTQSGCAWSCSKQFVINGIKFAGLVITCTGLKPNTLHNFYIDGLNFTGDCALIPQQKYLPFANSTAGTAGRLTKVYDDFAKLLASLYSQVGTGLLSDPEGKLTFEYLVKQVANNREWGEAIVKGKSFGSSGYSTLMVQAPNSIATKLIAQRKPSSVLPFNPAGNP